MSEQHVNPDHQKKVIHPLATSSLTINGEMPNNILTIVDKHMNTRNFQVTLSRKRFKRHHGHARGYNSDARQP